MEEDLPYHLLSRQARELVDERERGLRSEDGVSFDSYRWVQGHDIPGTLPSIWQQQQQEQQQAAPPGACYSLGGYPIVGAASLGMAMGPGMQGLP